MQPSRDQKSNCAPLDRDLWLITCLVIYPGLRRRVSHLISAGRQTADSEGVLASCVSVCLIMHHYAWEPITQSAAGVNIMSGPLQECQHKLHEPSFRLNFTSHTLYAYHTIHGLMIPLVCLLSIKGQMFYFPLNNQHMKFLLQSLKKEQRACEARLDLFSGVFSKTHWAIKSTMIT